MRTMQEIQAHYLQAHNALGSHGVAAVREKFDGIHRQIWADCDAALQVRKGDLAGNPNLGASEIEELGQLEALFPAISTESYPPTLDRLANLEAKIAVLEQKLEGEQ